MLFFRLDIQAAHDSKKGSLAWFGRNYTHTLNICPQSRCTYSNGLRPPTLREGITVAPGRHDWEGWVLNKSNVLKFRDLILVRLPRVARLIMQARPARSFRRPEQTDNGSRLIPTSKLRTDFHRLETQVYRQHWIKAFCSWQRGNIAELS